jgi:polyribonucleotide nucleotidyltransferase
MYRKLEMQLAGRTLSLETGRLAKQSHGAVLAQYGETVVLATVVSAYKSRDKIDFLPLTVDYQEKTFAAGKIPGGFFKREGRPTEKEILTSRLIDRAMRPLFPKGYDKETQIVVNVLSIDRENDSGSTRRSARTDDARPGASAQDQRQEGTQHGGIRTAGQGRRGASRALSRSQTRT